MLPQLIYSLEPMLWLPQGTLLGASLKDNSKTSGGVKHCSPVIRNQDTPLVTN